MRLVDAYLVTVHDATAEDEDMKLSGMAFTRKKGDQRVIILYVDTIYEGNETLAGFVNEFVATDWHERVHLFLEEEGFNDSESGHHEASVEYVELAAAEHLGWMPRNLAPKNFVARVA